MKFFADGPSIPDLLLERCDAGRVVFLCGAGVSFPSGMPTFIGLTKYVIDFFDPAAGSEIRTAFQRWLDKKPSAGNMPLDQIFNLLHQEYGKNEVNALVTERLRSQDVADHIGHEHGLIKRISSNQLGVPQIVTTNFDLLFEGGDITEIAVHVPPAFPDLSLGALVDGVTYLHGRLAPLGADHHPYVLSSADFGRAYLSEAWATDFVRNLLERYTVVLVGYQAEDPPVKYLLQGLNHDGQFDRSKLYAFDKGRPEDIEAKWRDRGVTAIAYEDHPHLWQTMEAWADRADDPRAWRAGVIEATQSDPKDLTPLRRGQVVNVLRTVQGARLFSEIAPTPHPEWICVLDGFVRSAKESSGYGDDAETFVPYLAYGLDDDLEKVTDADYKRGIRNDNLLEWRQGDDNPSDFHCLGNRRAEGYETIPTRLGHLLTWIGKSIDSPIIAWWAARQNGLHPRLIAHIDWHLGQSAGLDPKARHTWNLLLEHHRDTRNRGWDGDWFDLKRRIAHEGWTANVLRDFQHVFQPRLKTTLPLGLHRSKPPSQDWGATSIGDIVQFKMDFVDRHKDDLDVPDQVLPKALKILEGQLSAASGILADLGTTYFTTPTCYPGREVDGGNRYPSAAEVITLFIKLYDRLAALNADVANAYATTWDPNDRYFFRKLKLYALSKLEVFAAACVVEVLMSFDQSAFWDLEVSRELLFLVEDRWSEFSVADKDRLIERVLAGPDQRLSWSDEEYPVIRDEMAARYGRYLELKGCGLSESHSETLEKIVTAIPRWNDGWATSLVTQRGAHTRWVGVDETPDAILGLPVSEIVNRAKADLERDFDSFTEKRPFTGLVKTNPRKALSALTVAARAGDHPAALWSALVNEMPMEIPPRLMRLFLHRLSKLPHPIVVELRHALGSWLKKNLATVLEFDEELGWHLYDHIVNCILAGGGEASNSALGEVRQGDEVIKRSRRTFDHAITGPLGMCAEALIHAVPGKTQEEGSLIPDQVKSRLERLFAAVGEGADHAVTICSSKLDWLMYVDPSWAKDRMVPMLAFDHSASEPAWNGLVHGQSDPSLQLFPVLKPLLLNLYPWIESFSWGDDLSDQPAYWLGWMCIFAPGEVHGLTRREMRNALRAMSDRTRNKVIFWLGNVGQSHDYGWSKLVVPFVENVWPRERACRTEASSLSWISLLGDTEDDFPAVYSAVKRFLVPIEVDSHPFYWFTNEMGGKYPITTHHPEAVLDLVNTVTPMSLRRSPYELPKILALITETKPNLISDPRYLRLIDLMERN